MALGPARQPPVGAREARPRYRMYGLDISSDIRLPAVRGTGASPLGEWTFRRVHRAEPDVANAGAPIYEQACPEGCHVDVRLYRVKGAWYVWNRLVGTFHIEPESRQVTVYAQPDVDERYLALGLTGQVSSLILHHLRIPVLHASAVVTQRGAIAFLGNPWQGKSTMAACFVTRGARLLTDDALPLRIAGGRVEGMPGPVVMKMWPAGAVALGLAGRMSDMSPGYEKKFVTLDREDYFTGESAPLTRLFLLSRYDSGRAGSSRVEVIPLSQREGLVAIMGHMWNWRFLEQPELANLTPIYAGLARTVAVQVLRYPDGIEHHDSIHEVVSGELEAST